MKRLISSILLISIAISIYGCGKVASESEVISTNMNNDTVQSEIKAIPDAVTESDGVIAPMESEELVKKLSMLQNGTTLDEITKIFGKAPFMVEEANTQIFIFFIDKLGDITITLWGTELFQATVECMDSVFSIDLGLNKEADDEYSAK